MTQIRPNKWISLDRFKAVEKVFFCDFNSLSSKHRDAKYQSTDALVSKEEREEFEAVFQDVVEDLTHGEEEADVPEVMERYARMLRYNVPGGKMDLGVVVVAAYKMLEKPEKLSPENIRLANIMGWCLELITACIYLTDDIVDRSEIRRGAPCWYKTEGIGLNAITDVNLLELGTYTLLKRHFSNHHCYLPTMELFHDTTLKTSMGQILDTMARNHGKPNWKFFTMEQYNSLIKYKTACFSYLPGALAMYMANLYDTEMHRQAKAILMEMGRLYQIQDDFFDCFGDPEVTGKQGNDIREGKCTWLAVTALQRANPAQRKIMEEFYGRPEPEAVETIRKLYEELGLPKAYAMYEEESYNVIRSRIEQVFKEFPQEVFLKLLKNMYRRKY